MSTAGKWPSLPRVAGAAPRQAHADLPEGTYEREFGAEGFGGPATHLLHRNPPTGWTHWEGPLRPRAFDVGALAMEASTAGGSGPWDAPRVLHNAHLDLRVWRTATAMDHLVRNADGDELIFVHAGSGSLFCDFGHMTYTEGDYVVLPRGNQWRVSPSEPSTLLLLEATGESYGLPDRGLAGHHAFFDPALLQVPELDHAFVAQRGQDRCGEQPWRVVIKRRNERSVVTFPFNPLDTVGWQGTLLPVKINWRELRPLMSHRYHLPPSAHATFVSERFLVCTFCPRPIESDPGALKVPFFHSNNDYDEVLFYHRGDFFSRDGIEPGMLSLHPGGFAHGPHPKALAASRSGGKTHTDEVAVMIDARDQLEVSDAAGAFEWEGYVRSWGEEP